MVKFCTRCGAELSGTAFCTSCGAPAPVAPQESAPSAPEPTVPSPPVAAPPAAPVPPAAPAVPAAPQPTAPIPRVAGPEPGVDPGEPTERRRVSVPVLVLSALLIVAVAVAVGAVLLRSSGSSDAASPTQSGTPAGPTSPAGKASTAPSTQAPDPGVAAARSVTAILRLSASGRSGVQAAASALANCDTSTASAKLGPVVAIRQRALDQARTVDWSTLPAGAEMKSHLVSAFRASLSADQEYLAKADAGDCSGTSSRLAAYNARATAQKKAFVRLWNAHVATKYPVDRQDAGAI